MSLSCVTQCEARLSADDRRRPTTAGRRAGSSQAGNGKYTLPVFRLLCLPGWGCSYTVNWGVSMDCFFGGGNQFAILRGTLISTRPFIISVLRSRVLRVEQDWTTTQTADTNRVLSACARTPVWMRRLHTHTRMCFAKHCTSMYPAEAAIAAMIGEQEQKAAAELDAWLSDGSGWSDNSDGDGVGRAHTVPVVLCRPFFGILWHFGCTRGRLHSGRDDAQVARSRSQGGNNSPSPPAQR